MRSETWQVARTTTTTTITRDQRLGTRARQPRSIQTTGEELTATLAPNLYHRVSWEVFARYCKDTIPVRNLATYVFDDGPAFQHFEHIRCSGERGVVSFVRLSGGLARG